MPEQRIQLRALGREWIDREQRRALELVEQLLEAGARAMLGGERAAPEKIPTLARIYDDWIARRRARGLRNTKNERAQLEHHVLPTLGKVPLDEIRVRHMRDLVDNLRAGGLAPRTVRSIYGTVHKLFSDLIVDEILSSTPCVLTKDQLPRLRDKDPEWRVGAIFARGELEMLISAYVIPWDRRVLNAIKLLTGARIGEAVGLRWRDLDHAAVPLKRLNIVRSYAQLTKTETPRRVPVHPVLNAILREWKQEGWQQLMGRAPTDDDLIVPSRRGRIRSRHQHRNKFLADLERLGMRPRRVHDTRRTFITLAQVDGARRDVLEQITHAAKGDIIDLYTSLPWPTLCEAVRCLRVRRLGASEVERRLTTVKTMRDAQGQAVTDEKT